MAKGVWKQITTATELQRSSHVISAVNSAIYVFGGELVPRQPRDNTVFKIDINGDSDVQTVTQHEAPTPRVGSASAVLGNKIYLFSGRGGIAMSPVEEHGALHVFDTAASKWSVVMPADASARYPQARSYHCMTGDGNATIFVHAGCPEKGRLSDLWAFDTRKKSWTELVSAPGPARGGTSMAFVGGKIYRMNGFDGTMEQGGNVDVYDVSGNKWESRAFEADGKTGPEARSVSALVPVKVDGKVKLVTLFGERDPSSLGHAGAGKMLGDWWVYDVEDRRWEQGETSAQDVPAGRGWFDADVYEESKVVLAGGLSENNERLDDVWELSLQ